MQDKRNMVIALLVIALVVLGYLFWVDKDNAQQDANTQQNGQNNAVAEPPPPPPAPTPSPDSNNEGPDDIAPAPASDKFANNNWVVVAVVADGKGVDMNVNVPKPLILNFDKAKKTYSGFAGCNSFSGGYTASGSDKFDFGATAATKIYCVESSPLESKVFATMDKVDRYLITAEGNLVLKSGDGQYKIEYKPAI